MERAKKLVTYSTPENTSELVELFFDGDKRTGFFTTTEVMQAFGPEFLDETRCREWILKKLHGDVPSCPRCKLKIFDTPEKFWQGEQIRCEMCGKKFTALSNTFLAGTQFDLREILLLAVLLWYEFSNQEIARVLKVDQETIRIWRHKFDQIRMLINR